LQVNCKELNMIKPSGNSKFFQRAVSSIALRLATTAALAVGALGGTTCVQAQPAAFPGDRPVVLMIPFAAGGPTDILARMMAGPMGKYLGGNVVVENATGAGGTIGATKAARSSPTGHTVFLHHMGMATAPALYRKLQFDPMKDFEFIGQVVDVPMTLLARKDFPANNFSELLAYVKTNKDKVSLANAGLGAVSHLCGLLFMSSIQTDLTTVPYSGTGPAMQALLGSQVDLLCDQTTTTVPLIKDGRVKAFGVTTLSRLSALPALPTLDEQGLKGFEVKVWHGLYAPKGTPQAVLDRLNGALKAAMADPALKQRLGELNADIVPVDKMTPQGLKTFLESETAKWGPVIKKAGIYAD
jgi:tripartite-type tricarboxylate transporter receptor subunit TctC